MKVLPKSRALLRIPLIRYLLMAKGERGRAKEGRPEGQNQVQSDTEDIEDVKTIYRR